MVEGREDSPMYDTGAYQNRFIGVHSLDEEVKGPSDGQPHQQPFLEEDDQTIGPKYVLIDSTTGQQVDSCSYTPLIDSKIVGAKDVFKNIKNDKEFDAEIARISQTLADDKTADWKQRVNDLQRIQFFAQAHAGKQDQGQAKFSTNAFVNGVNKLVPCLIAQVLCLRSQNAKEAGIAIQMCAESLGDEFESAAFRLVTKDALVKLCHAGKHILAEIGTSTIVGILLNVCSSKVLQRLAQELQESRSTYVQKVAGMIVFMLMQNYPRDVILSLSTILRPFVKHCVSNPNGDCRAMGRKALLIWQQIDAGNAERVFHGIEQSMQRAILDDEARFELHKVRGDQIELMAHVQHNDRPPANMTKGPSSQGRALGSPKPHALASPKLGSPKAKTGDVRTVSRGKPRPGSAACAGTTLRGTGKGSGSAQRIKHRGGQSGTRLGGTLPTMQQPTASGLGFHAQTSSGSQPSEPTMTRTTYKNPQTTASGKAITGGGITDPLMGSFGSTNSGPSAMKPPSSGGPPKASATRKTPLRQTATTAKPSSTNAGQATCYKYDFNPKYEHTTGTTNQATASGQADVVMKQQPAAALPDFSFQDNFFQLQSQGQLKRSKALEDLMRYLVLLSKEEVSYEAQNPNSKFADTVALIQERFCRREDHSSMKALELQIDTIQFFLNSIPESLIDEIGPICMSLVNCCVTKRNPKIQEKGYEVLDEIKRIFTEGVVLPHFLNVYQNERSTEFTYILEAMSFMHQLVQASDDLNEPAQFEYISQTVGHHLENYLRYNRKEKTELDMMIRGTVSRTGGAQKHMEVISLKVFTSLRDKNEQMTMQAILELPYNQIDYLNQIANEYDPKFGLALTSAFDKHQKALAIAGSQPGSSSMRSQRSPRLGSPPNFSSAYSGGAGAGHEQASNSVSAAANASGASKKQGSGQGSNRPAYTAQRSVELSGAVQRQNFMEVDEDSSNSQQRLHRGMSDEIMSREEKEKQDLRAKMMLGSQMKNAKQYPQQSTAQHHQPAVHVQMAQQHQQQSLHQPQRVNMGSPRQRRSPAARKQQASGRSPPGISHQQQQTQAYGQPAKAPQQIILQQPSKQTTPTTAPALLISNKLHEICFQLNDQTAMATSKLDLIKHTVANLREILWTNSQGKTFREAQDAFEVMVDCLIFFILKYTNLKQQAGNMAISKLEEQTSQQLAHASFDLLLAMVNMTPYTLPNEFQSTHSQNPNCPPLQIVDTSRYFDGESSNASPLTLREKLVRSVLHTYSADVPQQHQTFANAKAEDLLRGIAMNTTIAFVGTTVTDLIVEMEPPRLQAVLRMTENRVKSLSASLANQTYEMCEDDLEHLLRLATSALAPQLNHTVPDVRKTVVFCLVEVGEAMGLQLFSTEVMERHLNISQQRLVQIYIERKQFQNGAAHQR